MYLNKEDIYVYIFKPRAASGHGLDSPKLHLLRYLKHVQVSIYID